MNERRAFRFGVVAATAADGAEWLRKARRAEELGYGALLVPDRVAQPRQAPVALLSPIPALAAAAAVTSRICLGTWVLASGLRNPAVLAREAATLALLSGGRFELGLGAGVSAEDYELAGMAHGSPGERVERVAAAIRGVRAMLGDATPPITVAGAGPRMLALAGREADAVALGVSPVESEEQILERIATLREAAGERAGRVEISMTVAAVADGGEAEARAAGRLKGRFGVEIADLVRAGSPSVLSGSVDDMCEQLEGRRERLGVSYLSVADDAMEVLAPVVSRLAGR